ADQRDELLSRRARPRSTARRPGRAKSAQPVRKARRARRPPMLRRRGARASSDLLPNLGAVILRRIPPPRGDETTLRSRKEEVVPRDVRVEVDSAAAIFRNSLGAFKEPLRQRACFILERSGWNHQPR